MSAYTHRVALWNQNHSHPEYPTGFHPGILIVDYNGIAFEPDKERLPKLAIHYDNLTSTYTKVIPPATPATKTIIFQASALFMTVGTLGLFQFSMSHLSLKFKLVDYDKVCVVGFVVPLMTIFGRDWAERMESMIWDYKRIGNKERRAY